MELHPKAAEKYDQDAEALLRELTPAPEFTPSPDMFKPEIPLIATFGADDILNAEDAVDDPALGEIARFFSHDGKRMGFQGEAYKNMVRLCERVQGSNEVRETVSLDAVKKAFFAWVRERYANASADGMTRYVLGKCSEQVNEMEVLIPIAVTIIQSDLQIGRVTLKTFKQEAYDSWLKAFGEGWQDADGEKATRARAFVEEHADLLGKAVASMRLIAESRRAFEIALDETQTALALMRLFTKANLLPNKTSYCRPLGMENIEQQRYLIVTDGVLSQSGRGILQGDGDVFLSLSDEYVSMMRLSGLDAANTLLMTPKKSEFQKALLDTLILYSRHTLAKNVSDKLLAIFGALDSFLLKDDNESIQQNISERIAFAVGQNSGERSKIVSLVKKAYGLRSQFVHHAQKVDDADLIREFLMVVWRFFLWMLFNHAHFPTRKALFDYLNERKFA